MRKFALVLMALCLCLSGCGQPIPVQAADGADWSENWVTVGNVVGVDTPEGMAPQGNNDALAANGMYYAIWSMGASEPYTNEDGDEVDLYDAQIHLLLAGYNAVEKAEENAEEWRSMANDRYVVEQTKSLTCNGQEFTVLTYTFDSKTNPYARGASAFGVYRNYAISVELSCREGFTGDPLEVLTDFLEHCHYST